MRLSCGVLFAAVTVVVVLAAGDPNDGSTVALDRALRAALDDRAEVVIRADDGTPADASSFVARVEWSEHERRALVRTPNGAEREIRFSDRDAPAERGRTVGFALASMVPDELIEEHHAPPPSPPAAVVAPPPVAPRAREAPPLVPPSKTPARFSVELLGQGATGIGGTAGGLGGAVAGRLLLPHGFTARLGFALRLGEVPSAQATSRVLAPSLGAGWSMPLSSAFRVGGRVDALLLHQFVSHFSSDDPEPDGRGRFVPGAAARLEGSFRIAESTTFMLAFGPEIAFGTTHLVVVGKETDEIPPVRLCGEVGVAVAF